MSANTSLKTSEPAALLRPRERASSTRRSSWESRTVASFSFDSRASRSAIPRGKIENALANRRLDSAKRVDLCVESRARVDSCHRRFQDEEQTMPPRRNDEGALESPGHLQAHLSWAAAATPIRAAASGAMACATSLR